MKYSHQARRRIINTLRFINQDPERSIFSPAPDPLLVLLCIFRPKFWISHDETPYSDTLLQHLPDVPKCVLFFRMILRNDPANYDPSVSIQRI